VTPELGPETWRELSSLLDEVFGLEPEAREAWLADLKSRNPERHEQLLRLLTADAGARSTGFLELTQPAAGATDRIPGDRVGAYRLVRELGRGGMGTVWLADRSDGTFKRSLALKLPLIGIRDRGARERFDRERDILAALAHPNIARLYDAGVTADGQPFLALEYVDGAPVTDFCRERSLGVRPRIELFLQVLDAVQFAHRNLIVHRDLKPSNVLVDREGVVQLLDFGIAKLLESGGTASLASDATRLDGSPMTPRYASPEQITGAPVTTSSDVYSLGVMLFELLAGRLPYRLRHGTRAEIEAAITSGDTIPPSRAVAGSPEVARALRGDLDAIVIKALERDPAARYPSAESLASDLTRYLRGEPMTARALTRLYRARKFVARHRVGVGLAAAVTVAILASTAFSLVEMRAAQRQRDRAEHVSSFLVSLFSVSDPSEAKGKTVTAREILDRGAAKIDALSDEPLVQSDLLLTMGQVYESLGLYQSALPMLARSLDIRRAQLGSDGYDTMESLNEYATLLQNEGQLDKAEPLFREALERRRRVLGPLHKDTLNAENNLALVLQSRGRLDEADALFRESLDGKRKTMAPDDSDLLPAINNLGNLLKQEGKIAEAKPYLTELVEKARTILGEDDPHTLIAVSSLALLLGAEGFPSQAEPYFRDALERRKRVIGPEHPQTYLSMYFLADCLLLLDRPKEAKPLLDEAAAGMRRVVGPDHPRTLATINEEGILAEREGRLDDAESLYRQAIEGRRRKLGPDQSETLDSMRNLGLLLLRQGRLAEADAVLADADERSTRTLAPGNPTRLSCSVWLAGLRTAQGRAAEALPAIEGTLASARKLLPSTNSVIGSALFVDGRCLAALGRTAEARAAFDEAASILRQAYPAHAKEVEEASAALAQGGAPGPR
jgi:serine/threonine-protein kinase